MIRSNLCDYGDAYIILKGTITVHNMATAGSVVKNGNKKLIFTNCAPFTDCIIRKNNTQVDEAQ